MNKRGFTSLFILILLTLLMMNVILVYKLTASTSVLKQNTLYTVDYNNKEILIRTQIISEINKQLVNVKSGAQLKEYLLNMNTNLDSLKTSSGFDMQIVSLSNTVYQFNIVTSLYAFRSYDMKFSIYVEIYKEADKVYKSKLRGVIL